jgi:hypothetical protein
MEIVQRFKEKIAWYSPTTDEDTWREFEKNVYDVDYTNATVESLKKVAWNSRNIASGADAGMWGDRRARVQKFLAGNLSFDEGNPIEAEAIQYDFVACFLNDPSHAAHNADLWASFNSAATTVLQENIVPTDLDAQRLANLSIPGWTLGAIPLILFSAFKTVNLSYYRPSEDTDTWAYFQNIVFDLSILGRVQFVYRHTYYLSSISSGPDAGVWSALAGAATQFLNANLGRKPASAKEEIQLAINFCDVLKFDYQHAAHNADLFKAYTDSFQNAKTKLQALRP